MELSELRQDMNVRVTIEGTLINIVGGRAYIKSKNVEKYIISEIYLDSSMIIEPLEPDEWPPQIGDVWEADGNDYYVSKGNAAATFIASFDDDKLFRDFTGYSDNFEAILKLNPKLVRRRNK